MSKQKQPITIQFNSFQPIFKSESPECAKRLLIKTIIIQNTFLDSCNPFCVPQKCSFDKVLQF